MKFKFRYEDKMKLNVVSVGSGRLGPSLSGRQNCTEAVVDLRGQGQGGPHVRRDLPVPHQAREIRALAAGKRAFGLFWL